MRRVLVQVHLWLGVTFGLYLVMMSLTGSAIVARRELTRYWIPEVIASEGRAALDTEVVRGLAQARYPDYEIVDFRENRTPRYRSRPGGAYVPYPAGSMAAPVEITFQRDDTAFTRRFDPYTGSDLGELFPAPYRALMALIDLHNDLLGGRTGRMINGTIAAVVTLLLLTGIAVWWPAGARRWRSSIWIRWGAPWRTQLRQIHNTCGFWLFLMLLLWTLSGVYFAFPDPFEAAKEFFFPPDSDRAETGDFLLAQFTSLHFGRFGGPGVRITWIVLGLVPAALAVTGALMWWYRVLEPALRKAPRRHATRLPGE
ncbi:MAG: PepSY-associated TM helix domain-containing protein [Steroidobacteraceae bacterium]